MPITTSERGEHVYLERFCLTIFDKRIKYIYKLWPWSVFLTYFLENPVWRQSHIFDCGSFVMIREKCCYTFHSCSTNIFEIPIYRVPIHLFLWCDSMRSIWLRSANIILTHWIDIRTWATPHCLSPPFNNVRGLLPEVFFQDVRLNLAITLI